MSKLWELLSEEMLGSVFKGMFFVWRLIFLCRVSEGQDYWNFWPNNSFSENCSVHCRLFSSIPGLYPTDTNNNSPLYLWWFKISSDIIQCLLESRYTPSPSLQVDEGRGEGNSEITDQGQNLTKHRYFSGKVLRCRKRHLM